MPGGWHAGDGAGMHAARHVPAICRGRVSRAGPPEARGPRRAPPCRAGWPAPSQAKRRLRPAASRTRRAPRKRGGTGGLSARVSCPSGNGPGPPGLPRPGSRNLGRPRVPWALASAPAGYQCREISRCRNHEEGRKAGALQYSRPTGSPHPPPAAGAESAATVPADWRHPPCHGAGSLTADVHSPDAVLGARLSLAGLPSRPGERGHATRDG